MESSATSTTRDRLLDATGELLRIKGPSATGTAEILTVAAAPRGSFYFHFPQGKEQLVSEAMHRCAGVTQAGLERALDDGSHPFPERVQRLMETIAADLVADDFRLGCAVGATTLEASATSPVLRQATDDAFSSWGSALTTRLTREGLSDDEAGMLADVIISGMEGATMLARSRHDPAPLINVGASLRTTLAHALSDVKP